MMKQCGNCEQWIPEDYQVCPACGSFLPEQQLKNEREEGKGTGCFYTIIIGVIILILGGIALSLYNKGVFGKWNFSTEDSTSLNVDSNLIEVGLPEELILDGALYGKDLVTVDVIISTTGNVSGRYYDNSKKLDYPVEGQGDSKNGVIVINIKEKDLTIELTPVGNGNYDAKWSTSTSEGTSYFYQASGIHQKVKVDDIPDFNPDSLFESDENLDSDLGAEEKTEISLEGKLDGEISIQLSFENIDGGAGKCHYIWQGEPKNAKIKCKKESKKQYRLLEYDEDGDIAGAFVGKFEDGIFIGKYVDNDGQEYAVTLFEQ